jgi:hypothetical protein
MRLVSACLIVTCLSASAAAQQQQPTPPIARQVRSSTRWGLDLIEEGRQNSASFRLLVDALHDTDIVVYVQPAQDLPGVTEAVTEFVAASGPARYLRIWMGVRTTRKRLIALLGHELQHALEIGRAREVVDITTLQAFYRKNGDRSVDGYDSEAARRIGDAILLELWGR